MFLASNLSRGGFEDAGLSFQGIYIGCFQDGVLAGVVCHAGNGMLLVQADAAVDHLAREALRISQRPISGISGPPPPQVRAARRTLDLADGAVSYDAVEILFALDLAALREPAALVASETRCRRSAAGDLPLLRHWMTAYRHTIHGTPVTADLLASSDAYIRDLQAQGHHWLLELAGQPVAMASFNATLPRRRTDIGGPDLRRPGFGRVQIGGVWTPPERRGHGYARTVIAGALASARDLDMDRAVLFTNPHNLPAQHAYRALGFEEVGEYGIVLFS